MTPAVKPPTHVPRVRINALMQARLLRAIVDAPCTLSDMFDACGGCDNTVRAYIRALHKERLIHVAGYERAVNGARVIRLYAWNPGAKDTPQPRASHAQRSRQYRARKKANALQRAFRPDISTELPP